MKKILPVRKPLFSGYPATGYLLSVLQCYDVTKEWLYNNYIQLFSPSKHDIDFFDICIENCPFIDYNIVDREFILNKISFIDYIVDMIDMGYYVCFMADISFISAYDFKGLHDPMVYGYDLDNKELYIADHFVNGRYSFAVCSFDEMEAAVNIRNPSIEDNRFLRDYKVFRFFRFDDSLYKYKIHYTYDYRNRFDFSVERVRESLRDYIECKPTVNWYTRLPYLSEAERKEHSFGLECYDLLIKQISWAWDNKFVFRGTRQSLYVEYSHKLMMENRVKYLGERGILKNWEIHEKRYGDIMKDSQILLMSYVKTVLKQDYMLEQRGEINSRLEALKNQEYIAIRKILMDI